ncbi:MAG: endo-1,4-beta-xylanase [Bacteroidota bacterium]
MERRTFIEKGSLATAGLLSSSFYTFSKNIQPDLPVGWALSFKGLYNPYYRARENLKALAKYSDYLKMKIFVTVFFLFVSVLSAHSQAWKQAAHDSIMKYRTTPLSIEVVNESGEPLEGIAVHVKLIKHQFKWGTTVNVNEVSKILGNKGTFNTNSKYLNHFRLFNSVTPDNAGKWKGWIDPSQRATYLRTIEWLDSEGIANRGHTCVWESERFNAIPDILIGQTDTAVVRAEVKKHITNIMTTLSDKIYEMDVVNELIHEQHIVNDLLNVPDPALEHSQWYKWAKQAAPDVDLIANEFDLFQSGNNFYQRYIEYVEKMIADGAPVDGVGMQGHFWTDMPSYEELQKRINQVKPLGLPMAVTEFDMKGKAYGDMERVMYAVFSEPQMYGFTIWGAWDGSQWRNNGPLFEENWSIKPSGQAWLDLVHGTWSNDTMAVTNAEGKFEINAYKGTHLIQIFKEGKVFTDTVEILDEKLELTYSDRIVKSLIPTGSLSIDGNNNEFNIYQPANLRLESNYPDSIMKVEFFEGLFMQYRDTSADFSYEIINSYAGTREIYAKITCKNGYSFLTDTVELTFVNKNAFPVINEVYPYLNQVFIYGQEITVACDASDYENAMWKVELSGFVTDTVMTDTTAPYMFTLTDMKPGNYSLQLKALDSLYGFNTRQLAFSVVDPGAQNVSVSSPINASDDVEQLEDGSIETEGDLDMGEKLTGIRFPSSNIPYGALIDSAFIQFTADNVNQGSIRFDIQAENLADAAPFTTSTNNITERTVLTDPIAWEPEDWLASGDKTLAQRTPDLKVMVESLIALEDWSESSPVNIILGLDGEETKRRAKSVDIQEEAAPILLIYYRLDVELSAPDAPSGLHISNKSGNQITLEWTAPDGDDVLCYFIYVDGVKYDLFGTKNTSFVLETGNQTTHQLYVTAMSKYSLESAPSNTINSGDAISGIIPETADNDFLAFPNPFSEQVKIIIKKQAVHNEAAILNIQGQVVHVLQPVSRGQKYVEYIWNGKNRAGDELAPGVYFIKRGGITKKIIKK